LQARFVTQNDKSEQAASAQLQSKQRRQVGNGAVSYRASDEAEYSGLPWRPHSRVRGRGATRDCFRMMCRKYLRAILSITVETSSSGPDTSRRFASRKYSATSSSNLTKLASSEIGVANRSRSSARIVSLREGMRTSQDYFWLFDLEGREATSS
jgi:hypothetical protein